MTPADLKGFTADGLDTLRRVLERARCHVAGHRWVLATLDPVLMWPFNVCTRCGKIHTEEGEP